MRNIIKFGVLLWAGLAFGEDASGVLQTKLNAIHTMNASFNQIIYAKKRTISRSSGTMALSRPGKFRWETQTPLKQVVIADGKHLWVYDVDLEQVTKKIQDQSLGGTAALFLSGYGNNVSRDFMVTTQQTGKNEVYELTAKSTKANFHRVQLGFNGDELKSIDLFDQLGQRTEVKLSHIKQNPSLSQALFQFKVPRGVDVVKQ